MTRDSLPSFGLPSRTCSIGGALSRQELELTPEEALIYGIDYADEFPEDADERKETDDGRR